VECEKPCKRGGTGRTRLQDRIDRVVAEGLDSGIGPVNGTELGRGFLKGSFYRLRGFLG